METQLRFILFILGAIILIGVAIDVIRRKPKHQKKLDYLKQNNELLYETLSPKKKQEPQTSGTTEEKFLQENNTPFDKPNVSLNPVLPTQRSSKTTFVEPDFSPIAESEQQENSHNSAIDPILNTMLSESTPSVKAKAPIVGPTPCNTPYEPISDPTSKPTLSNIQSNDLIAITLRARDPRGFRGSKLLEGLTATGFEFGTGNIFYRYSQTDKTPLIRLSQSVEPGYFDMVALKRGFITGITAFIIPTQLDEPLEVFEMLIRAMKQLSFSLNGELMDEQRNSLTLTTIEAYRSQLKQNQVVAV